MPPAFTLATAAVQLEVRGMPELIDAVRQTNRNLQGLEQTAGGAASGMVAAGAAASMLAPEIVILQMAAEALKKVLSWLVGLVEESYRDFAALHDATVELEDALAMDGASAGAAALEGYAAALAKVANVNRTVVLGLEAQAVRLGVSSEQTARATSIALGLAKVRGVSDTEALHAVVRAIEGNDMQLRRLLGMRRAGGGLTGNALLGKAAEVADKGLALRQADATNTFAGAVQHLTVELEQAGAEIGRLFGPYVLTLINDLASAVETLADGLSKISSSGAAEYFGEVWAWLKILVPGLDYLSELLGGFFDLAKDGWDAFANYMKYIWDTIVANVQIAMYRIEDAFLHPIDTIKGTLNDPRIAAVMDQLAAEEEKLAATNAKIHADRATKSGLPGGAPHVEQFQGTAAVMDVGAFYDKLITAGLQNVDPQQEANAKLDTANTHLAAIRSALEGDKPPPAAALAP